MDRREVLVILVTLLVALLISGCTGDIQDPIKRINFRSPFEKWRTAYDCLQNISTTCPPNFRLNETGLIVQRNETHAFCNSSCPDHARDVLHCLSVVKNDFIFRTGATIWDLYTTLSHGCSTGFDGTTHVSSASYYNLPGSKFSVLVAAIVGVWFLLMT